MMNKCNWNGSKYIFSYHSPGCFKVFMGISLKNIQSLKEPNEASVEKNVRKIRRWMNVMGLKETVVVAVATEELES